MPGPVPADQEITVALPAQDWQVVMDTLSTGPYRQVAPVIQKMAQQFEAALPASAPPPQLRSVE